MDQPGYLQPHICIESHSNVNLYIFFHLEVYICHNESFRKSWMELVYFLCLHSNRKQMPVCAKMISSEVRKVSGIAKAHMSPNTL